MPEQNTIDRNEQDQPASAKPNGQGNPGSQAEHIDDIKFEEALEDDKQEHPKPEGVQQNDETDVVNVLRPKAGQKKWTFGEEGSGYERTYVQKPLSFISKMQWFSLVGEVLDKAMGGDNPLTVSNLLSGPSTTGMSMQDLRDADTFIHAIGKLVRYAPEFLEDSYCIWLNVPDYERELVKQLMRLHEDEGGLSDADGLEIVEIFIDQNYEALDSFFRDKLGQVQKRVQQRMEEAQNTRSQQSRR
jgi:hypothetical protein